MNDTWERMPVNKVTATLILVVVVLIALFAVIASSIVKIDGDEVGIVEKKLFGGNLPEGKVLAVNGENGIQAQILAPGWHVKWKWQYNVTQIKMTEIRTGFVGLIQAADGQSLHAGVIYAPSFWGVLYGFVLPGLKIRVKWLIYMGMIKQILNSCLFFYLNIS